MGHLTSSAQFSRMMNKLLERIPASHLIFFLDDLALGSHDVTSLLDRLELVLERFRQANLKLSPGKCKFLRNSIQFIGMTISAEGIQINEDRVKALQEVKEPSNKKMLQKTMGLFNYNRKWIPNYLGLTRPMYALLQKDTQFN